MPAFIASHFHADVYCHLITPLRHCRHAAADVSLLLRC